MTESPVLVLKFGGSVLRSDDSIARAVHEIYRHVRDGLAVVAVVSALHGETDALTQRARCLDPEATGSALATLLATGELQSAALLALAVRRAGLACEVATAERLRLLVRGTALDAEPVGLDVESLRSLLQQNPVVVVPGFVGVDDEGRAALLGRGGSDFTALFLAQRLGARCRLVKDVRGLYERDPARPGPLARPFASVRYEDALRLDGRIVQHKAVRFAEAHALRFEVSAEAAGRATVVGAERSTLLAPDPVRPPPLRVAVLGAGTVGLGVVRALQRLPEHFAIANVAVRSLRAARDAGLDARGLTTDPVAAASGEVDVVVEALGGIEPARSAVLRALENGIPVVTANKALLARHGTELAATAVRAGTSLRSSAAVGGAAPVLETIARALGDSPITGFVGVLNATSGFVLDSLVEGRSLEGALAEAEARGFAERDATLDLDGTDAAQKLVLAAAAAGFACNEADVETKGATAFAPHELEDARAGRGRIRLVSRFSVSPDGQGDRVALRTGPVLVHECHELAFLAADECGAVVRCESGATFRCRGRGAGRWPTTEAVLADLLDLLREREGTSESNAGSPAPSAAVLAEVLP